MKKQHASPRVVKQRPHARNEISDGTDPLSAQITARETVLHKRLKGLHTEMIEARNTLLALLDADPSSFVSRLQKMQAASDKVDASLATAVHPWQELVATWAAFKKTRDEQIIPAVLAGHRKKVDVPDKTAPVERCTSTCAILINHYIDLTEN